MLDLEMLLLISLFACHAIGDYSHLSTMGMLKAKGAGKPLLPIVLHAWVHASLVGVCLLMFLIPVERAAQLALFQFGTHFVIDVLKGKMNVWFPVVKNPMGRPHWYLFGLDQLLHAIVLICIYQGCK